MEVLFLGPRKSLVIPGAHWAPGYTEDFVMSGLDLGGGQLAKYH